MMLRLKKGAVLLIIFFGGIQFACNYIHAQNWPKIYGDNIHALIKDLNELYDKGFVLTAFTYDFSGVPEYGWIIKTDINGNILWDKKFGDGNDRNWLSDSYLTTDHGLITSGITNKYSGNDNDPLFIKTDVCGEIEWCEVLTSPGQNYGNGIIQIEDGSYIGLLIYYGEGETYARISLVKMDPTGEPIWIQQLAHEDTLIYNEEGYHLLKANNSNCLISGRVYYPGMKPYWIMTDTSGVQIWDLKWSGIVGICFQTTEHQPGIFYSIGYQIPAGHNNLPAIYKFNEYGNQLNKFLVLGDTIYRGGGGSIINFNDSSLLIGLVWSSNNKKEIFKSETVLIDTLGSLINRRLLLLEDQAPTSMLLASNQKILVAGNYFIDGNWDIYLWKMNAYLEDDTLYTQPLTYDSLCPYEIQSDTVDLDCSLFVNIDEIPTKEAYESTIKISPNPARDWISLTFPENISSGVIELAIYDILGQEVVKKEVFPDNRTTSLNISNLSSGIYIAVTKDQRKRIMKGKFVVER